MTLRRTGLILLSAAVVVAGVVVARGLSRPAGDDREPPIAVPPDATVKAVMAGFVDPSADALWEAVGSEVTVAGARDWVPVDDAAWVALVRSAATLGAGANALLVSPRVKDETAWRDAATALLSASRVARRAAEARDAKALFASGEAIVNACDSCHEQYWNPALDPTLVVPGVD